MKHVSLLFAFLLCSLFPNFSNANNSDTALGSIEGTVIDNAMHQPVAYAAIVIKSEDGSETITGGNHHRRR